MNTSGRWILALGGLVAPLLGGVALADTQDRVTADALFREARELIKARNYLQACPKLAESFRLEPAPGTLYNLAECEEKQGKIASSLQRWQSLVDMLTASKRLTDARLPAARQHVEALSKRVPRLELRLQKDVPDSTVVLRDGVELREASFGLPLPVEPGEHQVIVRAAYRRDNVLAFSLREGETRAFELSAGEPDGTEPKAAPPVRTPPPAASSSPVPAVATAPAVSTAPPASLAPSSSRRTLGLAAAGVGAAALIGAGVTGLVMRSYRSKVEDHCDLAARQCDDTGYDAAQSSRTLGPINLALWVVGAAGVGAGTYLFVTAPQPAQTGREGQPSMLWIKGVF